MSSQSDQEKVLIDPPKKQLQLIDDNSNAKLDITHYINIFATSGLLSFYLYFPPLIPVLWKRCRWVLGVLATPIALSALYPIEEDYQPKVSSVPFYDKQ